MRRSRALGCLVALVTSVAAAYVAWTALFYSLGGSLPLYLFLHNASDTPLDVVYLSEETVIATAPSGDVGAAMLRMHSEPYASFFHALLHMESPLPNVPVHIRTVHGRDLWSGPLAEGWAFGRQWEVLATEVDGTWTFTPARSADGERLGPF